MVDLADYIASKLLEDYTVGDGSVFCDTYDWWDASHEEVAETIRDAIARYELVAGVAAT